MFSYTFIKTKTNISIKVYLKIILCSNLIKNFFGCKNQTKSNGSLMLFDF